MTKLRGGSSSENSAKNRNISRIWVKIGVSRGKARLAPAFAHSVFKGATRKASAAAPFFGAFQPFSSPLESKSFRVSTETRTKGDPMQAQRSGKDSPGDCRFFLSSCGSYAAGNGKQSLDGEKEETRSTAEEKAAAF